MLTFNFSIYPVGTTATPKHFSLSKTKIRHIYTMGSHHPLIPDHVLQWALISHTPGDSLLTVQLNPHSGSTAVVRYQVIVS